MTFKKFFLLSFIVILSYLIISYFFIFNFSKTILISFQKKEAEKILNKVEFYFSEELNNLHTLTKDWAAWNDAYLFLQDKNPDFAESNIVPETFLNLKIDLLLYTYLNGNVKVGGLFDKNTEKIYIDKMLSDLVSSFFKTHPDKNVAGIKKLIFFKDKPFMIAVYPVLKSDYTGPEKGYLFVGKFLTSEDMKNAINLFDLKELQILKTDKSFSQVSFLKADINEIIVEKDKFLNDKNLKIRINLPVESTLIDFISFYLVTIQLSLLLVFGIILAFLIDSYILKPLLKILNEVNQVKNREKAKLSLEHNLKEYYNLASTINKFLEDISIREKIYSTIAEKTEALVVLFDMNKNILFNNSNTARYLDSEELKSLMEEILKRIKDSKVPNKKLKIIKEFNIKDKWFNFNVFLIDENLYLLIGEDITTIKKKEEALFKLATQDFLTELYNRRYFEDVLERIEAASKRGERFVLLFIDCDDLKKINDTYGHLVGDEFLKTVSRAIKKNIRKEDLPARWGGDEFVIILNHCDKETGIKIARRILETLEQSEIKVNSEKIKPSVSIGLVEIEEIKKMSEVFKLADKLAYEAKKTGNKIKFEER